MQDAAAALTDFTQTISLKSIAVGESALQLLRFGSSEARLTGALRTDGIVRALGGFYAGAFTTAQRDAIGSGFRPYGLVILNTTNNRLEINLGSDPTPSWQSLGTDPAGSSSFSGGASSILFTNQAASNFFLSASRSGDSVQRVAFREDGRIEMGPGNAARDAFIYRSGTGIIRVDTDFASGRDITIGRNLVFPDGSVISTSPWSYTYASMRLSFMFSEGIISPGGIANPNPQNSLLVSAGTGFVVNIGPGAAFVQGDDDTWEGLYAHLQRTSFQLLLNPAAPATNPRIDAIGIQFNDPTYTSRTPATSNHSGNIVQFAGTPTAGASLANLNGAPGRSGGPSLAPSFLILAYVLINPGDSGVISGQISDQRKVAGPAIWGEDNHRYRLGIDSTGVFGIEQVI